MRALRETQVRAVDAEQRPTDEALQQRYRTVCCDFHDKPADIAAHWDRWAAEYGVDPATGRRVQAPPGWAVLPLGTVIPNGPHRYWMARGGWCYPFAGRTTVTPIYARPAGPALAYAVPVRTLVTVPPPTHR